jgi:hypothetical protein
MQAEVNIDFEQLVKLAKKLPSIQWKKLKKEVEEKEYTSSDRDLVSLLLSAPTYSKKQLDEVAKTRKAINQWRTK